MSRMRSTVTDQVPTADAGLHELAREKVRRAMAALADPESTEPAEITDAVATGEGADALVQQALDRLRQHVHSLAAVDHAGQPISEERLVRLVIGPLAERSRDADTAAALLAATTSARSAAEHPADTRPAPPTPILDGLLSEAGYRYVPAPAVPTTGWPADPPVRDAHVAPAETRRA